MEPTYQVEDNSNQDHFKYNSEPQMPTLNTHSEQLKDQSDENTDTKITADLSNKRIETNSEDSGSNINNEESETKTLQPMRTALLLNTHQSATQSS